MNLNRKLFPRKSACITDNRLTFTLYALSILMFAGTCRADDLAAAALHSSKANLLLEHYSPTLARDEYIRREMAALDRRLARARLHPAPAPLPALSEEAYISPSDGSAQPFLRYLPSAWKPEKSQTSPRWPLLVYLHGYSPDLNQVNWIQFPPGLTNVAEELDACVALPFGRSNTDYQNIGEQDVLHVIDLMQERYHTDPGRVILIGCSMGGMGVFTIGARFAERFNGLMIISGRGDYYTWHKTTPDMLSPWEREYVEAHFLSGQAARLRDMPILGFHGTEDRVIRIEEARTAFRILKSVNPAARLVDIPDGDHFIMQTVFEQDICRDWLRGAIRETRSNRPSPLGIKPGSVPSRIQNAFLDPFLFVHTDMPEETDLANFQARCREWMRYAKAMPRQLAETELSADDFLHKNIFLFGEPEHSPLASRVFRILDINFSDREWNLGKRSFDRKGNGLWFAIPSPWATQRTVSVQCGSAWGLSLSDNHRYDRLPDLIIYSRQTEGSGSNIVLAAARITDDLEIIWY